MELGVGRAETKDVYARTTARDAERNFILAIVWMEDGCCSWKRLDRKIKMVCIVCAQRELCQT